MLFQCASTSCISHGVEKTEHTDVAASIGYDESAKGRGESAEVIACQKFEAVTLKAKLDDASTELAAAKQKHGEECAAFRADIKKTRMKLQEKETELEKAHTEIAAVKRELHAVRVELQSTKDDLFVAEAKLEDHMSSKARQPPKGMSWIPSMLSPRPSRKKMELPPIGLDADSPRSSQSLKEELHKLRRSNSRGGEGWDRASNDDQPGLQGLLIKVNHVSIVVHDAEASKNFYAGMLGATIMNRPNFPSPGYWLWLGNVQLHLIQSPNAEFESQHGEGATGDVNHISFEVHDFEAVEAKLSTIGAKFKKNRVPEQGQVINQIFLQDPDGHYVEICDCNRFSDFVFGPPPDKEELKRMAGAYLEGVCLHGAFLASVAAMAFVAHDSDAHKEGHDEHDRVRARLAKIFRHFAGDDGRIDASEMRTLMDKMGHHSVTDAEITGLFDNMDEDGSGFIEYEEFAEFMAPRLNPCHSADELRQAFSVMDRDGSGYIDAEELLLMLYGLGQRMDEQQLARAMAKVDKDGDGRVSCEEFIQFFHEMYVA